MTPGAQTPRSRYLSGFGRCHDRGDHPDDRLEIPRVPFGDVCHGRHVEAGDLAGRGQTAREAGDLATGGERSDLVGNDDKVSTLADLGISRDLAADAVVLAAVPDDVWRDQLDAADAASFGERVAHGWPTPLPVLPETCSDLRRCWWAILSERLYSG